MVQLPKTNALTKVIHKSSQKSTELYEDEECFTDDGVFSKSALGENTSKTGEQNNTKTVYGIRQAVIFCPAAVLKMYKFIDQLLTIESSRTIIQTMVNLFLAGAAKDSDEDRTGFLLTKQFYQTLASTLNLQYGNILAATSTSSQLQSVVNSKWPFFGNYTDLVDECLKEFKCNITQYISQNIGSIFVLLAPQLL